MTIPTGTVFGKFTDYEENPVTGSVVLKPRNPSLTLPAETQYVGVINTAVEIPLSGGAFTATDLITGVWDFYPHFKNGSWPTFAFEISADSSLDLLTVSPIEEYEGVTLVIDQATRLAAEAAQAAAETAQSAAEAAETAAQGYAQDAADSALDAATNVSVAISAALGEAEDYATAASDSAAAANLSAVSASGSAISAANSAASISGYAGDIEDLKADIPVLESAIAGKSDIGHNHDDRYYTESEVNSAISSLSSTYAARAANLSDLADAATARENLGLLDRVPTFTNIITNGDFSGGDSYWSYSAATLVVAANVAAITGNGTSYQASLSQITSVPATAGAQIYVKLQARVTNAVCASITARIVGTISGTGVYVTVKEVLLPTQDEWYDLSGVVTLPDTIIGDYRVLVYQKYADSATQNGKVMEVKYASIVDATSTFGAGNEPTAAQLDTMFDAWGTGWFDGTALVPWYDWLMAGGAAPYVEPAVRAVTGAEGVQVAPRPEWAEARQVLIDHFDRVDNGSTGSLDMASCGIPWSVGGFNIRDCAAVRTGGSTYAYALMDCPIDPTRIEISAVFDTPDSGTGWEAGFAIRGSGSKDYLYATVTTSLARVAKRDSSTFTTLTTASVTTEMDSRYTLRLTSVGDVITLYIDDVVAVTHTLSVADHAAYAGRKVGLCARTTDNGTRITDYRVRPLAPVRPLFRQRLAHRGRIAQCSENSLRSIAKLPGYVNGIEIDVRQTYDGEFVLMHDATVDRTTNGTGAVDSLMSGYVTGLLIEDGGGYVPTLAQALAQVGAMDHIKDVYVHAMGNWPGLLDVIDASPVPTRCLVYMGLTTYLSGYRTLDPVVRLALYGVTTANAATEIPAAQALGVEVCHVGSAGDASYLANRSVVPDILAAGMTAGFPVAEEVSAMLTAVSDGCESVVTRHAHLW